MRKPKSRGRTVKHTLADGTVKTYKYGPHKPATRERYDHASVAALIRAYQNSPAWSALAPITQRNRTIYLRILEGLAALPAADIRRRDMLTLRDAIAAGRGPGAANGFLVAAKAVFGFAVEREWIETNPAQRVPMLPGGHLPAWTRAQAERAARLLAEHWRRVVVLALYTGQRRGDLVRLRWADYDGQAIRLRQQKAGPRAPLLVIPCHPALKAELDRWPRIGETILTKLDGAPFEALDVSRKLPAALQTIGLPQGLNIHGLRKLAAASLADAGCSVHEIAAITGHKTLNMVQLYTATADQERLAASAICRLTKDDKHPAKH